jgi:hypothetical protein
MSTITVSAPRTHNWMSTQIAIAVLIALAVGMLAFSIGRLTATDHSSTAVPHTAITPSGSEWGWRMCAHGVPCR